MHIVVVIADDEYLVLDLLLDGYHLVHIEQIGPQVDIVALAGLSFLVEQFAVDDDFHEQCGSVMAEPATIGIPESTPVGGDGIALEVVAIGIHAERHGGDAVVVEELVMGKGGLFPGGGIVGIGRFRVKNVGCQFGALVFRDDNPVHRGDGVEEGRVEGGDGAVLEDHIEEDITVVVGLLGRCEQLQQLFAIGDDHVAHGHAFLLEGYELLIVADIDEEDTVGHVAQLHTEELLEIADLFLGSVLTRDGEHGVAHEIAEQRDGQTYEDGHPKRLTVAALPVDYVLPEGFHHCLFNSNTLAVALFMRFIVLPMPAP